MLWDRNPNTSAGIDPGTDAHTKRPFSEPQLPDDPLVPHQCASFILRPSTLLFCLFYRYDSNPHMRSKDSNLTCALLARADLCSSYRLETPSTLLCGGSNTAYWSQTTTCKYIRSNFNSCIQQASPITCGAFPFWVFLAGFPLLAISRDLSCRTARFEPVCREKSMCRPLTKYGSLDKNYASLRGDPYAATCHGCLPAIACAVLVCRMVDVFQPTLRRFLHDQDLSGSAQRHERSERR